MIDPPPRLPTGRLPDELRIPAVPSTPENRPVFHDMDGKTPAEWRKLHAAKLRGEYLSAQRHAVRFSK